MSKHISLFDTEVDYQAEVFELEYPNVSLVEDTGKIVTKKNVVDKFANLRNAPFGAIVLASTADLSLSYVTDSEYNATDYPYSSYVPIAVQVVDNTSLANGAKRQFFSTLWPTLYPGVSNKYVSKSYKFGLENVNIDLSKYDFYSSYKNKFISTNYIKQLINFDNTHTIFDDDTTVWEVVFRYKTLGTNEGDWTLPKYFYNLSSDYDKIQEIYNKIRTEIGNANCLYWSLMYVCCCDIDNNGNVCLYSSTGATYKSRSNTFNVLPCIILN